MLCVDDSGAMVGVLLTSASHAYFATSFELIWITVNGDPPIFLYIWGHNNMPDFWVKLQTLTKRIAEGSFYVLGFNLHRTPF